MKSLLTINDKPEEGFRVVDDSFIRFVIFIGEENGPIRGERIYIDCKPMVLRRDETALSGLVGTRLVVSTVTVPKIHLQGRDTVWVKVITICIIIRFFSSVNSRIVDRYSVYVI